MEFDIRTFTARLYSYDAWTGFYIFKIFQLTLSFFVLIVKLAHMSKIYICPPKLNKFILW